MKKLYFYSLLLLGMFTACTSEEEEMVSVQRKGIMATTTDFVFDTEVSDISTRSTLQWVSEGRVNKLVFGWKPGECIAVFSDAELVKTQQRYEISTTPDNNGAAYFEGGGFQLLADKSYYSFIPERVVENKTDIVLSYANQNQKQNDDCSHLGDYDYQVAASTAENGFAQFKFAHLGTAVRFQIGSVTGKTFKKFELITADNYDFQYTRHVDLTDDGCDISEYNPQLSLDHDPEETGTHSFALDLGQVDPTGAKQGITPVVTADNPDGLLKLYMMVPASKELIGKKIYGVLTEMDDDKDNSNDKKYYLAWTGKEFKAGSAISFGGYAATAAQLNISLKIDRSWKLGNTQDQTRAVIGDPGIKDKLDEPDHIYIYTCKNGKLYNMFDIDNNNPNWKGWSDNGKLWSYSDNIRVDLGTMPDDGLPVQVYAIASKDAITRSTSIPLVASETGTNKSVIEEMVMTTTATEDLLKNLYSYNYELAAGAPPVMDVTLYHTAAKLDIQWNATENLSGNVSINSLPNTNLLIFKPTENTATGSWSPSETINTATMYNGRAVFYVPQLKTPTYNVTIGSSSSQDINFTTPKTNGWTSWFKGNVKL